MATIHKFNTDYPCLKIHRTTEDVYLFNTETAGTCIQSSDENIIGYHSSTLSVKDFMIYDGIVRLIGKKGKLVCHSQQRSTHKNKDK